MARENEPSCCPPPAEPVWAVCAAAIKAVGDARRSLRRGDKAACSRDISRARAVLTELSLSGRRHSGGAAGEVCDYLHQLLIEASAEKSDACLARVAGVLAAPWVC
jgi:hypothetical protein